MTEPPDHPQRAISREVGEWLGYAALGLAVIGALLQLASVNLLTGDAIYWFGAALAVLGVVFAWINGQMWLKIVTLILATLCVVSVINTQNKFDNERHQIQQELNNVQTTR